MFFEIAEGCGLWENCGTYRVRKNKRVKSAGEAAGARGGVMALVKTGGLATDATGAEETLTLSVVQAVAEGDGQNAVGPNQASEDGAGPTVQIASAFYGKNKAGVPLPAEVSADRQSLTLRTLHGVNELTVNFVTTNGGSATAQLVQGEAVLMETTLGGHTGDGALMIEGT